MIVDTEILISELKRFARMTGGEYSDRPGLEYLVVDVEYSNGLITLHLTKGGSVPLVLLSTSAEIADGSRLRCTFGFSEPDEYFDVYPGAKKIEIGSSNPPMYATFEADKGLVESIDQVIRTDRPNRVHRVRIGWSPPVVLPLG